MIGIRPLTAADAPALAGLYRENREHLRAWEPDEPDDFYTPEGQRAAVETTLRESRSGRLLAWLIVDGDRPLGRVNLNHITMGPLRAGEIGLWVDQGHVGRGVASRSLRSVLGIAFDELGLHRLTAFVRTDNLASQHLFERIGFRRFGLSDGHVYVNGRWRDAIGYQCLAPWHDDVLLSPEF
ncbi:GNAT family N-acetyltransferase [Actinacidiphila rubida]|uniref:[SSU ribosomal protein S5P]-alanine acetyltransferase n=1 Tax=Actinacidiphila rubida TaxID=310780 RepID=A0A1H8KAL6_9ACTN|nr:GNAT family protein [Actinacidiphila rubida]SEN90059.1 [SSU ribosomal protein S5P]-alanine acetyltransferase [Actinacidiphila rubida]